MIIRGKSTTDRPANTEPWPLPGIFLQVRAYTDHPPTEVFWSACELATRLGIRVHIEVDGKHRQLGPGGSAQQAHAEWLLEKRQSEQWNREYECRKAGWPSARVRGCAPPPDVNR